VFQKKIVGHLFTDVINLTLDGVIKITSRLHRFLLIKLPIFYCIFLYL